jgi:hypothetical protein
MLRSQFRDAETRKQIMFLYTCHKSMFMGERMEYAIRVAMAVNDFEGKYLSIVMDGMQQTHSEIPWMCNNVTFGNVLKQHLQGVTVHGKASYMFRTFNNCTGGTNLAIHTLLLALWKDYVAHDNTLPGTVYIECDGGSENANQDMKNLCALLIMMDLGISTILLVRMPSGHNHADQDSKFGALWKATRSKNVITPQGYKRAVEKALLSDGCQVFDLHVLPDWASYLNVCRDKKFGLADKMEHTQLVWRFQKVEVSCMLHSARLT